jgi:hypothetical protein
MRSTLRPNPVPPLRDKRSKGRICPIKGINITYTCWLNQVEPWFEIINKGTIRRGSFSSVKNLIARIESSWRLTTSPRSSSTGPPQRI